MQRVYRSTLFVTFQSALTPHLDNPQDKLLPIGQKGHPVLPTRIPVGVTNQRMVKDTRRS